MKKSVDIRRPDRCRRVNEYGKVHDNGHLNPIRPTTTCSPTPPGTTLHLFRQNGWIILGEFPTGVKDPPLCGFTGRIQGITRRLTYVPFKPTTCV